MPERVRARVKGTIDVVGQRGGQAFFLHNEVRNIEQMAREVSELVPTARVRIAHGQMPKGELEKVMLDFYTCSNITLYPIIRPNLVAYPTTELWR